MLALHILDPLAPAARRLVRVAWNSVRRLRPGTARRGVTASARHLDDRLLADIGLTRADLDAARNMIRSRGTT